MNELLPEDINERDDPARMRMKRLLLCNFIVV